MNMMDEKFMIEAITLAKKAKSKDEVPVGAVIVKDGKIIAKAFNKREHSKDATAHAEILAIKKACKKMKDFRLIGCDIYVTLEPCMMCLGAILNARIDNLFFGAYNNKPEVIDSNKLAAHAGLNHNLTIVGGVLENECSNIVSSYFKDKRNKL